MRYQPASKDPPQRGCQTGTLALARAIEAVFPELRTMDGPWGCYNRRRIAGSTKWSHHAEGRALDIGVTADLVDLGWALGCELVRHRTLYGTMRVLWDGHIWTTERLDRWERLKPGSEQHGDHLHLEQFWAAALRPASWDVTYSEALTAARNQ